MVRACRPVLLLHFVLFGSGVPLVLGGGSDDGGVDGENLSGSSESSRSDMSIAPTVTLDRDHHASRAHGRRHGVAVNVTFKLDDATVPRSLPIIEDSELLPSFSPDGRQLSSPSCFEERTAAAALPNLFPFLGGVATYAICAPPWHCAPPVAGEVVGGNVIQVHSVGQGDWSQPLDYTQQNPTACSQLGDWLSASGGIEYRTCKVTSPGSMFFAAFVSMEGNIDGFRVTDATPSPGALHYDWLRRRAPSLNRRRFSYQTQPTLARRRRTTDGWRSHYGNISWNGLDTPTINHLVLVPDDGDDWIQGPVDAQQLMTEIAPVKMLLFATWAGDANYIYSEAQFKDVRDALVADWCFWVPCQPASYLVCAEGLHIHHTGTCTPQCVAEFSCGYIPSPVSTTCTLGKFETTISCIYANTSCAAPSGIAHAEMQACSQGSCIGNGGMCTPQCTSPWLASETSLNCVNGAFIPATFTCYGASCAAPFGVAHSAAQACAEGISVEHNTSCTPQCSGNHLPSITSLSCSFGVLSPSTFTCFAPCAAPGGIADAASVACSQGMWIAHGTTCTTQCKNSSYTPFPASLACSDAVLSPGSFTCIPDSCAAPSGVAHVAATACAEGAEVNHGEKCTTQCMTGYVPSIATLKCVLGTLTPAQFICNEQPCVAPSGIFNANALAPCSEGSSIESGNSCTAQCIAGYTPNVVSLSCGLGVFTPLAFFCQGLPCAAPLGVTNAMLQHCKEGTSVDHTGNCTAQCVNGFYPSPESLSCSAAVLTPATFECFGLPCSAPSGIAHADDMPCTEGDAVSHGSSCTTQCQAGYNPVPSALLCDAERLQPSTFACEGLPCLAPSGVVHQAAQACSEGESISHSGVCTTHCELGYRGTPAYLNCTATVLNPSTFTCPPAPCTAPSGINHADDPSCVEGAIVNHFATCTSRCESLYIALPVALDCQYGVLTPPSFSCTGTPCAAPDGIEHAAGQTCLEGVFVPHDTLCTASCDSGYMPSVGTLTCNLGTLSPDTFTCSPASCPAPLGVSQAVGPSCLEGPVIPHGGNCTTQCIDAYLPTIYNLSCSYGVLTPETFECFGLPCPAPTGVMFSQTPSCAEGTIIEHTGRCTTLCLTGYVTSSFRLSCKLGVFNPPFYVCLEAPCAAPPSIANAASVPCEEGPEVESRDNCTAVCSKGFYPVPERLSCELGVLDPEQFECFESPCQAPANVEHAMASSCLEGAWLEHGENCTAQCVDGYVESISSLHCWRGEFMPATFACLGSPCTEPTPIEYTRGLECDRCSGFRDTQACLEGPRIEHSTVCTARCDDGFRTSLFSLKCSLGRLTPPTFTCMEDLHGNDHGSQLLSACMKADTRKVERLVAMRADLAARDASGATALHLCALHDRVENVERLLHGGAHTNAADSKGWAPLHIAAGRGHVGIVAQLLEHGADPLLRTVAGDTATDLAQRVGSSAPAHFDRDQPFQVGAHALLVQAERLATHRLCTDGRGACPWLGLVTSKDAWAGVGTTNDTPNASTRDNGSSTNASTNIDNNPNATTRDNGSSTNASINVDNNTNASINTSTHMSTVVDNNTLTNPKKQFKTF